jgi:hypothetical protein
VPHLGAQAQAGEVLGQAVVDLARDAAALCGDGLFLGAPAFFGGDVFDGEDDVAEVGDDAGCADADGKGRAVAVAADRFEVDGLPPAAPRPCGSRR